MKTTRTIEQCLTGLPDVIAKRLRVDEMSGPWSCASSLIASCWVMNPHDTGSFNVLIHPREEMLLLAANFYLHKGGKDESVYQKILNSTAIRPCEWHGKVRTPEAVSCS